MDNSLTWIILGTIATASFAGALLGGIIVNLWRK